MRQDKIIDCMEQFLDSWSIRALSDGDPEKRISPENRTILRTSISKVLYELDESYNAFDIANDILDGGCPWRITEKGELLIGRDGESYTVCSSQGMRFTWGNRTNKRRIKSVTALGNIKFAGDFSSLFRDLTSLKSADLQAVDFSQVTSLVNFFFNCNKLETVLFDPSAFGNVTDMSGMFTLCRKLRSIPGGWVTDNVTHMSFMFRYCESLVTRVPEAFHTGCCKTMEEMFSGCKQLEQLDLSGWDVGKVENMYGMFSTCTFLKSVDMTGWSVTRLTTANRMFYGCKCLKRIDLSGWDCQLAHCTEMFSDCSSASEILFSEKFSLQGVYDLSYMFCRCTSIKTLDISSWSVSNVVNFTCMFMDCVKLSSLDLSGWDVGNMAGAYKMFFNCCSLSGLNITGWKPGKLKDCTDNMFTGCPVSYTL